jgi:hypothetical protein
MTSKIKVENCLTLSIFDLKKLNVLKPGIHRSSFSWGSKGQTQVGYLLAVKDDWAAICLNYVLDNHQMDYQVDLTVTKPHLGGKRWWFQCPSLGCTRRVGKLYFCRRSSYFLCRHCLNLTYKSRFDSAEKHVLGRYLNSIGIGLKAKSITHKFYRNQPTKRYQRFINKYLGGSIPAELTFT